MKNYFSIIILALCTLGMASTSLADASKEKAEKHAKLQPFEAKYRINVSRIPTTLKAKLKLQPEGGDDYSMSLTSDSMLMKNREETHFTWDNCFANTNSYSHYFKGFRRERNFDMKFSDDPRKVHNVTKKKGKKPSSDTYLIDDDTLDELSMLLRARCLIEPGVEEYTVTTAYGDKLRKHTIEIAGKETLKTPLGKVETIRLEKRRDNDSKRYTVFWLAPELDYMLVRARHVEKPGLFGELRMISYKGPFKDKNVSASE